MRKNVILSSMLILCLAIAGCSMPAAAKQGHIYSFIKEEKKKKGILAKSYESVKDFRGIDMYTEDIDALKEEVEAYISAHSELSEEVQKNLRALKVAPGETKDEVALLLGEPDKITGSGAWVYKINKWRAFTVFIVPVLFVHEGYYLYFNDNDVLENIERHYLKQMIRQSASAGLYETSGDTVGSDSE